MKITVAQYEIIYGEVKTNFNKICNLIKQAKMQSFDIIVLPKNCLSGNFNNCFNYDLEKEVDELSKFSNDISIIFYDQNYSSSICLVKEGVIEVSYSNIFMVKDKKIRVDFDFDVSYQEDIVVILDSQKYLKYHNIREDKNFQSFNTLVYSNAFCCYDQGKNIIILPGYSFIKINNDFTMLLDCLKEELLTEMSNYNEVSLLNILIYAVKRFDEQVFSKKVKWIIGLSGGLDSSVSAAILSMAIGGNRMIGYNLYSEYNSKTSKNNAYNIAKALSMDFRDCQISDLVDDSITAIKISDNVKEVSGFIIENIQARIRGHLLSGFAANNEGVVVNNGNKVEVALGYCTLYGDSIGALGIIGDLTKLDLFELSREINSQFNTEIVPANLLPNLINNKLVFEFPPSAELRDKQVDPMKWGYHDLLTDLILEIGVNNVLRCYLDNKFEDLEISNYMDAYNLKNPQVFIEDFKWFTNTAKKTFYKRVQSTVIISLSETTYGGMNNNETQFKVDNSNDYLELINSISTING